MIFDVTRLGADQSGSAFSDTAFANANTAAALSAGTIYIPAGTYKLQNKWQVTGGNIKVLGDGPGSILRQTTLTTPIITNTGTQNVFQDIALTYSSQATASVPAFQNGTGGAISQTNIQRMFISNAYHGIETTNENTGYYSGIITNTMTGISFWMNGSSNINLENSTLSQGSVGTATNASMGLQMTGKCQGCNITNVELSNNQWHAGILGGVGSGINNNPAFCKFTNVYFDSAIQDALLVQEAYDCCFVDCWFSGGSNIGGAGNFPGCNIANGSNLKFIGCDAYQCGSHGYIVNGGKNIVFDGCSAISNSKSSGSGIASGIAFVAGITDFVVKGCICKNDSTESGTSNQAWGIIVTAGASDRYIIQGNLISTNVTGGVSDGGSGVNKLVANNY